MFRKAQGIIEHILTLISITCWANRNGHYWYG